ncbi:MAG: cofactor-independent phosphoglycerate mutase [Spirochaetes bacterium]|nr:cofactor-independent phosphoglycerate mutase [Spirochaetota bacterium]
MSEKKIIILVGDGMADYPMESLGGRTVLEVAQTPNMDFIARNGTVGLVRTVPEGMSPGSDTANLSIFGYNPKKYYTGRAPLEALNLGINLAPQDVAFRTNVVTIENQVMQDFSAHHIDSEFAKALIDEISVLCSDSFEFYPGVSYRNILVWRNYPYENIPHTTPPHDIQGKEIARYLPTGDGSQELIALMNRAQKIIVESKRLKELKKKHKGNPTGIWLWGGGRKPRIHTLAERFGLFGYTVAAVDLIHGIGRAVGLSPMKVEGATGYLDTNYEGKADAVLEAVANSNFVLCHVESPDESGHEGNVGHKIKAIEDFDARLVGRVLRGLELFHDWSLLVLPDHPTPITLRTHTADPVPFAILKKRDGKFVQNNQICVDKFSEKHASQTGIFIEQGSELIEWLLR